MWIFLKLKIINKSLKCSDVDHNYVRNEVTRIKSVGKD